MLLSRQLSVLRPAFIVVCGFMIYGCASTGIQTFTGEQVTNVIEVFERGNARLNCDTLCSGAWGSARIQAKRLYEQGLWNDLAIEVARVGFKAEQTYFYLGRAAEGLGYAEAARTYYKLGLASRFKCAGFFNTCDGLDLPNEILAGINRLPAPFKAEKSAVASSSNLIAPAENIPIAKNAQEEPSPIQAPAPIAKVDPPQVDLSPTIAGINRLPAPFKAEKSAVASSSNLIAPAENIPIAKNAQEEPSPIQTPAPTAKVEPPQVDLRSTIKVRYDEFEKLTEYKGANVATGLDVVFLRAWKPDKSPMVMQIYVMDYYRDEWRFYHSAWDSDGVKLDTTQISRDVGVCSRYSGCSHYEHIGLNVTRDYLEKHRRTGVRFKLSGKAGEEVFSIPAAHIDAFLEVAK
jgi:hypothetical protein